MYSNIRLCNYFAQTCDRDTGLSARRAVWVLYPLEVLYCTEVESMIVHICTRGCNFVRVTKQRALV